MTSGWIKPTELLKQHMPGKLKIIQREAPEELDCMRQFHWRLTVLDEQDFNGHAQCLGQPSQYED